MRESANGPGITVGSALLALSSPVWRMGRCSALPAHLRSRSPRVLAGAAPAYPASMTIAFIVMGFAGFAGVTSGQTAPALSFSSPRSPVGGPVPPARRPTSPCSRSLMAPSSAPSGGAFFAPWMLAVVGWSDKNRSSAVSLVSVGGGVAHGHHPASPASSPRLYGCVDMFDRCWRPLFFPIRRTLFVLPRPPCRFRRRRPRATAPPKPATAWSALRTPQFIVLAVTFFCCGAYSGPIFHTVIRHALRRHSPAAASPPSTLVEGVAGLFWSCSFGVPRRPCIGVRCVIVAGLRVCGYRHLLLHLRVAVAHY